MRQVPLRVMGGNISKVYLADKGHGGALPKGPNSAGLQIWYAAELGATERQRRLIRNASAVHADRRHREADNVIGEAPKAGAGQACMQAFIGHGVLRSDHPIR